MRGLVVFLAAVALALPLTAMTQEAASATAIVCTKIVDHAPQGAAGKFPSSVGTLFGFSQVVNVPTKIAHVWIYKDTVFDKKEIASPGPNKRWRAWTQIRIEPGRLGSWRLEVRNAQGTVLASHKFAIE